MTLLLDTHAFLWLVAGDDRLPPSVRALVGTADRLTLSAASVWEAETKRAAGRLRVGPVADAARRTGIPVLAVTAEHAHAAAHLPLHHRDPFDRMLMAQAMLEDLVLVSKDQAVRQYGVPTAW